MIAMDAIPTIRPLTVLACSGHRDRQRMQEMQRLLSVVFPSAEMAFTGQAAATRPLTWPAP
ncbi:MAG: hypothetical protein MSO56_07630 [Clostridiales bacterium]|nr:hypothetical protein [Clostridiales bacterium]